MDFPEPLFESAHLTKCKLCLVCGNKKAESVLRNTDRDVCPMCVSCSGRWNSYGYHTLKCIKPKTLLRNIFLFKLKHWLRPSLWTIWKDMQSFQQWANHMKKFKHLM